MSTIYQINEFNFSYPYSARTIYLNGKIEINSGDCILLEGSSGSGKSTILAAMKGLIPHLINGRLSGEILYHGESISNLNDYELLNIGYLQQNPDSQLICHNVYDELAFGLENKGLSREVINQKIHAISQDFDIEDLLTREVKNLSGGEKQKINLLAILIMEPEVLLLDEPTAFLDPKSAANIIKIIASYIKNKTVIIVEHNLHYLASLVNRVISIKPDGNIEETPLNKFVWHENLSRDVLSGVKFNDNEPNLVIKDLSFSYPHRPPLFNNLNLSVNKGEIIAICGGNGNGKSTLLKLISKIIPSKNSIFWHNEDINNINKFSLWSKISLLWQNPEAHFIHNSVELELGMQSETLLRFNLDRESKLNPFNLSEGQKRRLSLAIVLNSTPQLVLLDEPTFGQDIYNKQILANIISSFAQKYGVSFIIVSHDLNFVNSIADKIYHLDNGTLIEEQNKHFIKTIAQDSYERPQNMPVIEA